MDNRLQITPLIEENMNQMIDGEFAISQITGHVTYKKGEEYISKTKDISVELIDKTMFKDDLVKKIEEDEEKLSEYKRDIDDIESTNDDLENSLNGMEETIIANEELVKDLEERLRILDIDIQNSFIEYQYKINDAISENIKLIGSLMIEYELLDRIADNESYFEKYVNNTWQYPDRDDVDHSYGTYEQNEDNKTEMDLRVDKSVYDEEVARIEAQYAEQGARYEIV